MEIEVDAAREGQRLDVIMAKEGGMSRRAARRLIENGSVFVDKKRTRVQSRVLDEGALITWSDVTVSAPEDPINILRQGRDFVVVNKPAGMPTEPTRQASVGTLVETVRKAMKADGHTAASVAAVHRLDFDTTGAVLLTTTPEAAAALSQPFRSGQVQRGYLALVHGQMQEAWVRVEAPLSKGREQGRMVVDPEGKPSSTLVTALAKGDGVTLVSVVPQTGRTHQIRVHLAHIGHPIMGDVRYAAAVFADEPDLPFCLHAHSLQVVDPRDERLIRVCAPLPSAFVDMARSRTLPTAVLQHVAKAPWEATA